ncbi:MAG: hypothetical protein AAF583_16910 [Pseudomonadota bacterium]
MLKSVAKSICLRALETGLGYSDAPLNRLLKAACEAAHGRLDSEGVRIELDRYYSTLDLNALAEQIDYASLVSRLRQPGGYKVDVLNVQTRQGGPVALLTFGARKLLLLRNRHVRFDLMILRKGEQIPPHMHSGVVSGFYLVEGQVGIRHYDQAEDLPDRVLIKKTIDQTLDPGGYTTNSESHDNIHWLFGHAEQSILFRFNTTNLPRRRFAPGGNGARGYVDPNAILGTRDNYYYAQKIGATDAKKLTF